jgi:predicted porin
MKKSLLALAVLGALAGSAFAQTSVTVYGRMDIGLQKASGNSVTMGRGDNNVIGFRGTEDLGGGLSALFQAEMRFEPDTGNSEGNRTRPLFQGQTRVGLKGDFGTIRLGRGLTAVQDPIGGFDPWGTQTVGELNSYQLAGYSSSPLQGNAGNRFDNALFYNTPSFGGFQFNATVATTEAVIRGSDAVAVPVTERPYSLSGTYANGPVAAMVGYERNQVGTKFASVAASYKVGMANIMGTVSRQDPVVGSNINSFVVGADLGVGAGNVKVGYGQIRDVSKKFAVGYWHNLSKRTYIYTDVARVNPDVGRSVNAFDIGVHHNF